MTTSAIKGAAIYSGGNPYVSGTAYKDTECYQLFTDIFNSPYKTVSIWGLHINSNSDIQVNDCVVVSNRTFNSDAEDWAIQVKDLKKNGTISRIEVSILDDWTAIFESVSGSFPDRQAMLLDNFQILLNKIGFDAINTDNESTDVTNYTTNYNFVNAICVPLNVKYTLCPYYGPDQWADMTTQINAQYPGIIDAVYLQCYDGGSGQSPATWNQAFKSTGIIISPGLWALHQIGGGSTTCTTGGGDDSWTPDQVTEQIINWKNSGATIDSAWMFVGTDMLNCPAPGNSGDTTIAQYAVAINTGIASNSRHSSLSYLALRQGLGVLGISLPVLVWVFNGFALKSSISHFYYSSSSVLFTGFMFTFGIFLIFYPGRVDETDRISDKWVTTFGGIGAILTALIPTAYCSLSKLPIVITNELSHFCNGEGLTTQYIHNNSTLGLIHLSCAAIFLALMGYMSWARFTKGKTTPKMKIFYKFCAIMVWLPLVILAIKFIFNLEWTRYDVYILECVSLVFFGAAWLVKGKTFKRFGFH